MIRNIVFDFGGEIAPISRDKAVKAFKRLGLADADQRLDKYHQTGIFQELEEGKIDGASNVAAGKKMGFVTYQPANGEDWRDALQTILAEKPYRK